jgi:hypothetical protein
VNHINQEIDRRLAAEPNAGSGRQKYIIDQVIRENALEAQQDGCDLHDMSAAEVARWWNKVGERDVTVCCCCFGPAPLEEEYVVPGVAVFCKRCVGAAVELYREAVA